VDYDPSREIAAQALLETRIAGVDSVGTDWGSGGTGDLPMS
jgi:hypothetical protein